MSVICKTHDNKLQNIPHMNRFFLQFLGAICIISVVFAAAYFLMQHVDPSQAHFKKDSEEVKRTTLLDCAYFSLVTQSTVGYGAMVPCSTLSKVTASIQMVSVLAMFAYFATHTNV
jgi:hypothetical protein